MTFDKLLDILTADKPSEGLRAHEDELFELIPELALCKDFDQHNVWHIYDVYEHILHVVDGVPADPVLRMAALFHDVGKPVSYTEDSDGVGHFWGHWETSGDIFDRFAEKHDVDKDLRRKVSDLIFYHDMNPDKSGSDGLAKFLDTFDAEGINDLYLLKNSDLAAQNPEFYPEVSRQQKEQKEKLMNLRK